MASYKTCNQPFDQLQANNIDKNCTDSIRKINDNALREPVIIYQKHLLSLHNYLHINTYIMFILRKLFKEHNKNSYTESNQIIGDNYCTVTEHNEGWNVLIKDWEHIGETIYCFVLHGEGSQVVPLYKGQGNYIMTSDGKTFSNLTFKN